MKIGILDSGIGGVTVLKECLRQLPNHEYLYYADSKNAPYGEKTKEEVAKLTTAAVDFLINQGAEIVIIACNTATGAAAKELRSKYTVPIIGMEPALKPALKLAGNKRVLVTATELTLKQEKFCELSERIDIHNQADFIALPGLVKYAEAGNFTNETINNYLKTALCALNLSLYGSVVLGCTHFPLYKAVFEQIFAQGVFIVDGTNGTVNRLKSFIKLESPAPSLQFYQTGILITEGELFELMNKILMI